MARKDDAHRVQDISEKLTELNKALERAHEDGLIVRLDGKHTATKGGRECVALTATVHRPVEVPAPYPFDEVEVNRRAAARRAEAEASAAGSAAEQGSLLFPLAETQEEEGD